jgi:hypothetical protein
VPRKPTTEPTAPPARESLPSGLRLVRSRGENLPKSRPNCRDCGRTYAQHVSRYAEEWCNGYVDPNHPNEVDPVVLDIDVDLHEVVQRIFEPNDEYAQMERRIPENLWWDPDEDDVPTWLSSAGMTRADWETEKQKQATEAERNREAQLLETETAAELERWRDEIAKRPGA